MQQQLPYIGRFAPSPTGPLHLGSLYAALAGFLQAKSKQGKWLLRIDDLDTPRNTPGSVDHILTTLEAFGLYWDGAIDYQSAYLAKYDAILVALAENQWIYPCICSRKSLEAAKTEHRVPTVYPGFCKNRRIPLTVPHALRIKSDNRIISFDDGLQGRITQYAAQQDGDFIVKRKDGIIAYQLAVVIDDDRQHVNHIVRGCDLLHETPKQIFLQQLLGLAQPGYMHVPIITDRIGLKLSKQTCATAVDSKKPGAVLFELLRLLKQNPPAELRHAPPPEQLSWAIMHWNPAHLKNFRAITPEFG